MKRFLYIALLFQFLALLGTGVLRFVIPFSIELSRLHIFAGAATGTLILIHIVDRLRLLKLKFKPRSGKQTWVIPVVSLLACTAFWLAAWYGTPGVSHLMNLSYEQRNHAAIFRLQDNIASKENGSFLRTVKLSSTGASIDIELLWKNNPNGSAVAIWAETKSGSIIETLYLTGSLKYSESHDWEGGTAKRGEILPVWRHRYTTVCGVDPFGEVDLISQPTVNHQWLLDQKLDEAKEGFVIYVEVNLPGDRMPSIIYAANIEPEAHNPYTLLNLLAHSGGSQKDGELNYNLNELPMKHDMIERIILKTRWNQ
ncbi:MAG TPA: hypothetical protein DEP88_03330 [Verrucomicrobiales bacterium]|nr:hypothetical protein [Verrucomicrobiales bacterium]HCL96762.1 hypothetical protein [Verrucomicrobiales bacterium]